MMREENLISKHIGENLLYFMSFKESGTKSEFKKAIQYFINKYNLPNRVQNLELHYWSDYLLDDLSSLLHIEFDKFHWSISKPCLNVLPGYSGKGVISGARTPEIYKKIESSKYIVSHYFIDNSQTIYKNEPNIYARLNFFPLTIYISFNPEDLDYICDELNLNLVDTSPYEFLNCLPDLQEMIVKSSKIPDNSRSWVDLHIFDSFIMDTNCGKLLECPRCNISSFKSTHRNILDETIYRFKDFGESWQYFIKIDENLHNISKELAIWYLLSKNDLRHLYFDRNPLPFGTLIMPLDFKLPLLYRKALTLNTGVVPYIYPHRSTNNNSYIKNPMFIEYDNISKSFYDLLLKKLQFVDELSRPNRSWVGYNSRLEKSFTALDLCTKTINIYYDSKKDEN
jgi:hypothetical protein